MPLKSDIMATESTVSLPQLPAKSFTPTCLSNLCMLTSVYCLFSNLVELNFITINLYREAETTKDPSKRRKNSKGQNQLVGEWPYRLSVIF